MEDEKEDEKILIDVQMDAERVQSELRSVITSVADLKKENAALKKEIEAGRDATGELSAAYAQNADTIKNLQARQKALSGELNTTNTTTTDLGDSFYELTRRANALETQYKSLSKAQRESAEGQEMKKQLTELKAELKGFDAELGNYQKNVGNYPQTLASLVPGFDKVTKVIGNLTGAAGNSVPSLAGMAKGIGGVTKAALKFIATPIGAIIAGIVLAIKLLTAAWDKVTEAIAKNDDAGTAIARLYEVTIQPVINLVTAAFAKLAEWIGKAAGALADWLGGSEQAATAANSLVIATDELEEAERQYTVESARRAKEIARLRDEVADKEKHTAEERKQLLQQAIDLEAQNLEDEKRIKAERLRILEETAERDKDTSDETKNKIAQARADMLKAEEAYYSGKRRLTAQMSALNAEIAADEQKAAAERENAEKARKAEEEKRAKEEEQSRQKEVESEKRQEEVLAAIREKAAELAAKMIGDEGARALELRRLQGQKEIDALKKQLEEGKDLNVQARDELAALIKAKEQSLQNELKRMADDYARKQIEEEKTRTMEREQKLLQLRKEVAKEGSKELLGLQLQALDLQKEQELAKYAEGTEERLLIDQQYEQAKADLQKQFADKETEERIANIQQAVGMIEQMSGAIGKIEQAGLDRYKKEQNEKKDALQKQLNAGYISEEQYSKQVAALDEETQKREFEMQRKQAIREKALGIFNATLSTAAAIIGFLAKPGGIPGIALSAMAGITGAAQVAAIAAQPLPQFAGGTALVSDGTGRRYSSGDVVPTMLSNDEMVLNPYQYTTIARGLFDFANNPQNYTRVRSDLDYEMLAAAVGSLPAPVMVYSEYNDFKARTAAFKELARI